VISKAKAIEALRSFLGDQITSWLHAVRYYWLLRTKGDNEVDMQLIPRLVREGDVVIDVGANSADWTWRLSRQVGSHGRVFAFEADPYYAEVTRKVITLLGLKNVTFFPYGLSDKAGSAFLQIKTPGNERVVGTGHIVEATATADLKEQHSVIVRLMPLDEVPEVKPFMESVRLIKCDVEGHELNVFRGALSILNRSRPIVITEVGHTEYQGDNEQQLISFFQTLDYDCYVVGPDSHSLLPSHPGDTFPKDARPNRIMIPREKAVIS
jgi:FkbM family methyltransferase